VAFCFWSPRRIAKLNGLDPAFCLRAVLATIAQHLVNRIEELLPWKLVFRYKPNLHRVAWKHSTGVRLKSGYLLGHF
jgi:hypothetical protein